MVLKMSCDQLHVVNPYHLNCPRSQKAGRHMQCCSMAPPRPLTASPGKWARVCIQRTYTITPKGLSAGTPAFNSQHIRLHASSGAQTTAKTHKKKGGKLKYARTTAWYRDQACTGPGPVPLSHVRDRLWILLGCLPLTSRRLILNSVRSFVSASSSLVA